MLGPTQDSYELIGVPEPEDLLRDGRGKRRPSMPLVHCRHVGRDFKLAVWIVGVSIEYFGERRLLGALHLAQRLQPRSTAVLLCNPFGEEASRGHRTFRVLATQLERAGYSVLRFDYAGTGDSLGESEDATVDGWLADIGAAADHLRAASGIARITLVGLRFGATLAALATERGILRARHLVMWDPIVEGRGYLAELGAQHEAYMRDEIGPTWTDRRGMREDGSPMEALGAPISAELAAQLAAIDLGTVTPAADSCTVIQTRPGAGIDRLRARLPVGAQWIEMADATAWNSDAALNAMVVPMEIVKTVIARIEKSSP
jgi:pimeloyl-ACP methyl ester carboxylesterase